MRAVALTPLGARVDEVDVRSVGADDVEVLRAHLADHGVLVFPGQYLGGHDLVALLRRFGPLTTTVGEPSAPGHPELNLVTNVGRTTAPRSRFHVDTSYIDHPPAYTALTAVTVPRRGGATLFSDQRRALATLPAPLRAHIAGRTVTHVVTGVDLPDGAQASAEHPLVRPHPRTGRLALDLTSPARCAAVSGLDDAAARRLVAGLHDHSTRPANVLAHHWSPGDLVMWDNACVMHRADHAEVDGDRSLLRGLVSHDGYSSDTIDASR